RATLAEAMPLSRFMLEELASRHRMDEAEGRAACVHEARPLLALLPDSTLRMQIEREFGKLVQLTPEELAATLQAARAAVAGQAEAGRAGAGGAAPGRQAGVQQAGIVHSGLGDEATGAGGAHSGVTQPYDAHMSELQGDPAGFMDIPEFD